MMIPCSFDDATCRHLVGDGRCRTIDAQSRAAAEAGEPCPPPPHPLGATYWDQVRQEAEYLTGFRTYHKRLARIERMKEIEP